MKMRTEGTMEVLVDVEDVEVCLEMDYALEESCDEGVQTYPNGDPGVPPSCERFVSLLVSNKELHEMLREVCIESRLTPPHLEMIPRIRQRIRDYILEHA